MSQQYTVDDMMAAYAEDAVDFARDEHQVTLDYSEASVEKVEEILAKIHEKISKATRIRILRVLTAPPPDYVDTVSKMFGGYIGEVFKRHYGGEWSLDETTFPGEIVYTFSIQGHRIWPHFKAGKRVVNGYEDNVWHYYQVLARDLTSVPSED